MAFTREQAIKALKMTGNNVERAVEWIFAHPGNQETALNSQVFEESELTENDVFPAPSTSTSDLARKRSKKGHQMVGNLEKVKEKDQDQKNYEMAVKISQQEDPKPKGKGKKKRGIFEIDPIMARFGPGAEEASERKKSKKQPAKKTPASSTATSGSLNQPSTSTVSIF